MRACETVPVMHVQRTESYKRTPNTSSRGSLVVTVFLYGHVPRELPVLVHNTGIDGRAPG